jgi:diguanylate cyclase (GGDEF)-like protein
VAFKYRLLIVFGILAILPLLVAGWVIQQVASSARVQRVDDQLVSTLSSSVATYRSEVGGLQKLTAVVAVMPDVQHALAARDRSNLTALLADVSRQAPHGVAIVAATPGGKVLAGRPPSAPAVRLTTNTPQGRIDAYLPYAVLARDVSQDAGSDQVTAVVHSGTAYLRDGSTAAAVQPVLGRPFVLSLGGRSLRAAARPVGVPGAAQALIVGYPKSKLDAGIDHVRLITAAILGIGSLLILLLAGMLLRSLLLTMREYAAKAEAIRQGHFDQRVPVVGNDEFAQFGRAFNGMSAELDRRIRELETERARVRDVNERFGKALEATHDVTGLLEIVLDSAMQLAGARGGRLLVTDEGSNQLVQQLRIGEVGAADAMLDAPVRLGEGVEGRALQSLMPANQQEPVPALCVPLVKEDRVLGLLTVVEPEHGAFDADASRSVGALAAQGAVAIENARLHRLIQKQAKTDGLTGLANHREFEEQLSREVERAQRFGVPVALIVFDLDDFKLINDRFGHLAGDAVLRSVAATTRSCTRDIDHAARYGGEEFAVILPHTSLDGAARLAERLRQSIAEAAVPAGGGREVRVTSSFGVAAVPGDALTQVELVAAADAALYRAKQAGKNRIAIGPAQPAATPGA